jgi:hypothetical protein
MESTAAIEKRKYFCWVRVVSVSSLVTKSPAIRIDPGERGLLHWDLRPRGVVAELPTPGKELGVWSAADGFFGRDGADTAFDYGPAFLSRLDAMNWIADHPRGRQWDGESLNRFLMEFIYFPGGNKELKFLSPEAETAMEAGHAEQTQKRGGEPQPEQMEFGETTVTVKPPQEYVGIEDECKTLMGYRADRTRLSGEINREAVNAYQAVASVLSAVGLSTDGRVDLELKWFRWYLLNTIEPFILEFKKRFHRERPWKTCPTTLAPMLMEPDWRHPGHPAYPSGHATVAWTFAYFIGSVVPAHAASLERAAHRVALNREIAGVHYPSDSESGRELARDLVAAIEAEGGADYNKAVTLIRKLL